MLVNFLEFLDPFSNFFRTISRGVQYGVKRSVCYLRAKWEESYLSHPHFILAVKGATVGHVRFIGAVPLILD
jgi:hypothetical protein